MSGGLSRHTTLLNKTKAEGKNVLFLDNGGLLPIPMLADQDLIADIGFDVMELNGLDAMNLGPGELCFGLEYLAGKSKENDFPFLSSNLHATTETAWLKKYVTKKVGGKTVGIVGVLPEDAFAAEEYAHLKGLVTVTSPEKVLQKIIPELKDKTDEIILLSRLSYEDTSSLLKNFPEISIAITSGKRLDGQAEVKGEQVIFSHDQKCGTFRSLQLLAGTVVNEQVISLDESIQHTDVVDSMIVEPFTKRRAMERKVKGQYKQALRTNPNSRSVKGLSQEEFQQKLLEVQEELQKRRDENQGERVGTMTIGGMSLPIIRTKKVVESKGGTEE